jgi:hypothetical protein
MRSLRTHPSSYRGGWALVTAGAIPPLAIVASLVAIVAWPAPASADSMDPALARLVKNPDCRTVGPGGTGAYYDPTAIRRCQTDDQAFAKLVSQYGGAVAPLPTFGGGSTGFGGFELGIQVALTKIDADQDYWKAGTEGDQQENTLEFSTQNLNPDDFLQVYTLFLRKGFPLGFELGTNFGFMGNTSMALAGADVRWSLLEGFRTGLPGILPEVAVEGSVRTLAGSEDMLLTVGSFDVQVSKPIPIAGAAVVSPYVGYQWMRIFGNSGQIDLTPNTDPINLCGYQGPNLPGSPDPNKQAGGQPVYDGQPVCQGGTPDDFNSNVVFDDVALSRHRLGFGLHSRFQMVKLGAHFNTDVVRPEDANSGSDYEDPITGENDFAGVPLQWTLAFDVGAVF